MIPDVCPNVILRAKIVAIAHALPEKVVDNKEAFLDGAADVSSLIEKIGIRSRHVAGKDEFVSDLAGKAAQKLFDQGHATAGDIDALVVCSQTGDYALPGPAFQVHARLGLSEKCMVLDFNHGCTGFIYGLGIAGSLIHSGLARHVVLIMAETYSKWCYPKDKAVAMIFGDGASAVYLTGAEEKDGIGPFVFGSQGKGFNQLTVPVSGAHAMDKDLLSFPETGDASKNVRRACDLHMNGPEVFRFAMATVPALVEEVLARNRRGDIHKYVLHQANKYMLKSLQDKMRIADDKMIYEMDDIGNTVSASIPIAIERAYGKGNIRRGENLLLAGFGVGYSWGGTVIRWDPVSRP